MAELARTYLEEGAEGRLRADMAMALAATVMGREDVQLALAVLRGGEFVHARATELAKLALAAAVPASESKARSS